jgi:hypothetical protein
MAIVRTWSPIAPPRSRTWARLFSSDLSVGIIGLGRSDGASTYEGGRSSMHGLGLVSEKWARWDPRSLDPSASDIIMHIY